MGASVSCCAAQVLAAMVVVVDVDGSVVAPAAVRGWVAGAEGSVVGGVVGGVVLGGAVAVRTLVGVAPPAAGPVGNVRVVFEAAPDGFLLGEVLLGEVLLGEVLLGEVLLGGASERLLLGEVLFGAVVGVGALVGVTSAIVGRLDGVPVVPGPTSEVGGRVST